MLLGKPYRKFEAKCFTYSSRLAYLLNTKHDLSSWEFNYLTETLVSELWQSWCSFSRQVFLFSCRGCYARDGSYISPLPGEHSWKRLGYIAKQAISSHQPKQNGHLNFFVRNEPTWGDLNSFTTIVGAIKPSNYQNLLASYGSFSSLMHLQTVRNGCAHKNVETMTKIRNLHSYYHFNKLEYPTDLAWAKKIGDNCFALEHWIYEMRQIAKLATSTL